MKLSAYDRELLSGRQGEAKKIAMELVLRLGELYEAPALIPVTRAHIDGCSYTAVWEAGLEFAEMLAEAGGKVAVPTSLNIASQDAFRGKDFRNPEAFTKKCRRMERAYVRMGCIPSWTCASYQYCNIPAFGEHVAFAESNVVNFCNSVLGARTERNGDLLDICLALTGRAPAMGLHLQENRYATVVFDVCTLHSKRLEDASGFAALGHLVGQKTGTRVPVVDGFSCRVDVEALKAFSAASAASGAVGLFHVTGTTPEAPDLDTALGGKAPREVITVTDAILEEAFWHLSQKGRTNAKPADPKTGPADNQEDQPAAAVEIPVDLVVLGCPHLSYSEFSRVMGYLGNRPKATETEFWLQTNDTVYRLLSRVGMTEKALKSGIKIMRDSCIMNQPMEMWHFQTVVTNSGKMAHYAPGNLNADVYFRATKTCVETAVSGRLQAEIL